MKIVGFCLMTGLALGLPFAASAQETFSGSAALDATIQQAVRDGLIPGAVLVAGRDENLLLR